MYTHIYTYIYVCIYLTCLRQGTLPFAARDYRQACQCDKLMYILYIQTFKPDMSEARNAPFCSKRLSPGVNVISSTSPTS